MEIALQDGYGKGGVVLGMYVYFETPLSQTCRGR